MNNSTARPIFDAQLAANRANAQHSTGPQSSTAKAAVSLNAVKTGLTGQTVVLPNEDAKRYSAYIAEYEAEFQPVGIQERELVQSLADIRWRLNRIPALEAALDTYARVTITEQYPNTAGVHLDFILTVEVQEKNEKKLHNIHLHEARLARRRERELAQLHALQQERKAKEAEANEAAAKATAEKTPAATPQPAPARTAAAAASSQNGFEFTTSPAAPAVPSVATNSEVNSSRTPE